jgi:hypothetical protein
MRSSGRLCTSNQKQQRTEVIQRRHWWSWPGGRPDGQQGPFGTGAHRPHGGRGLRRLPSTPSPERSAGSDGEEGRSQAATGEGLSIVQLSRPHDVPMTAASSLRYASPLSAMHVDLGRMVVDDSCEANGFACARRCRVRKSQVKVSD